MMTISRFSVEFDQPFVEGGDILDTTCARVKSQDKDS
jgi:hypothetical protein